MHKYNFAVPVTSCRGCPSMAAGTLLQELSTLHTPYALTCSNWCRTDTSGEVPHIAHPPRLSALDRSDTRPTQGLDGQAHVATGACPTTTPDPCPRFPVGAKRAFPVHTLSAPNRSKRDSCCSARTSQGLTAAPPWWRLKIGRPVV